ncbi:DUF305 domain-containing protein [Nocardioides iriomotensis]|uniref:DUF305 domain-containing protein n=1 Tax=Nocardioides iriomotensis TaxID=715784 RepID=A0A4V1Z2T7_9ACTN|nr:DUF305 domain-containing protein [Nocardioides iriomotensis]RYU15546.1 DUF305 domain-containing protein [Nocardioides iriomotensis]
MRRAVLTLLVALPFLAACGGDGPNDADSELAASLIEQRAAGIELANTTIGRDRLSPRIAQLAEQIRVDGTADIDALAALLKEWGEKAPRTGFGTGDGHTPHEDGHGDLEKLAAASDARFERAWLERMIAHHQEALTLAAEIEERGESEELAGEVDETVATLEAELERMRGWLGET